MKKAFLLIAICLITNISFSQDRRRGGDGWNNDDRIAAREVRRNVIIKVHRDFYSIGRYNRAGHVRVYAYNSRVAWRGDVYGARAEYGIQRHLIRDEIRREIWRTREVLRREIRSAFRFWRE